MPASRAGGGPIVEVFSSPGCPYHDTAVMMVRLIAGDLGIPVDLRLIEISSGGEAVRFRSLGSPTIRVAGRDIEPGAERRTAFTHRCRAYVDADGVGGAPDPVWIRNALMRAR